VGIVQLAIVLHLNDNQVAPAVFGQHVHTVKFVVFRPFVAFAFKDSFDAYRFVEQGREKTFQYYKVVFCLNKRFIAQSKRI
jgi:hypothetical protein